MIEIEGNAISRFVALLIQAPCQVARTFGKLQDMYNTKKTGNEACLIEIEQV